MNGNTHITTEYVNCDLCGSSDHEILYTRTDPVTGMDFNLVECRCGMAFVDPMPLEKEIPRLYPADYLEGKERTRSKYEKMLGLLPRDSGKRLLDVGCGRGDFIDHAARNGRQPEGVDLIDWDSPYGLPIRVGNFLTMDLPDAGYDVVTAWALLEHVRAPSLFIAKAARVLRPGGTFIFVVPNVSAPGMRRSCSEDIPRHLWLFTPATVRQYLEKFGMEAASILHDGRIYRSYPFGLLRYALRRLGGMETRCAQFENKAVALLRNRQITGNFRPWLAEIRRSLGPKEILLDTVDLGFGVLLSYISRIIRNYGVITVIARKNT
jgi:ubiquinone/menaquinone biosynthesis C-methylase UbiE